MYNKVISSSKAVQLIKDGDVVGINGFVGFGHPEELSIMVEKRFLETNHPQNLTLIYGAGQGDGKTSFGLNHYAYEKMIKRVICGHIGLAPKLASLIADNKIEGYNFPQGVVTHYFRAIAGKKIGVLTHVGLKTFADPRVEGCKMNDITNENLVELIEINEKECLLYKSIPVNVALIRGTTSDEFGNTTMEKEATLLETLSIAQAAKNSGGIVIVQVERLVKRGTLNPQHVAVPGIMVDYIVIAKKENHKMSFKVDYDPAFSGETKVPISNLLPMELNERKVIARRCSFELVQNSVVNLGIGVPDGIANIAVEEGVNDDFSLSIESGAIGGVPGRGLDIGASTNADAIIDHPYQFDYYDGGGIDLAYLGLAQVDQYGNVNVSKFNGKFVGCGGFINISQNAKKVVFCGTFTSGGLEIKVESSKLKIVNEGKHKKFIKHVEQISFSGEYANEVNQQVLYVTERAVFELTNKGIVLKEIAPGVKLQEDILNQMDFIPIIHKKLKEMDCRIFINNIMGLKNDIIRKIRSDSKC